MILKKLRWFALAFSVIAGLNPSQTRCFAEVPCPWLNAATAGGVLGGEVQSSTVAVTPDGDGTCRFVRKQSSSTLTLSIEVHTMPLPSKTFATYLAQCNGTSLPLTAIGNEAFQCVSRNSTDGEEKVIGRVRDRAFVLTINASLTKQSAKTGLSPETRNVAEQVAGALF
ncbi:hypothetical protein [Tunturiibacter lichenicola]|jgi:hypothetical protein|uniref:hypothetical protein n=1 Tax=Tunturiibacter lichenicola TaxID=2051959 RepID=UPI003D9AF7CC